MSAKMNDIDNTALEEAVQAYLADPGRDMLAKLAVALKDTKLFVPARAIPEKGGFQPYVVKNGEGGMYMPAFTSRSRVPDDNQYQGMLKLPYKQCVSMVLDQPTLLEGIALNPYNDNLMLRTNMLELNRKLEKHEEEVLSERRKIQIKPEDFRMMMRHNVEFHHIAERLYAEKMDFIRQISEEFLCELYKVPYVELHQEVYFDYTKDDFEIMELNVRDTLNIMQIVTPKKHLYKTDCSELYVVWNPQTERIGYYIVEKGEEKQQAFLVCVKDANTWERLEDAPEEGNGIGRVMELFEAGEGA